MTQQKNTRTALLKRYPGVLHTGRYYYGGQPQLRAELMPVL
ncbi:hypothetical protein [Paenibacillus tarimensis]|nr:hypothetical protein [Paenibacillus tarimensis]